MIVYPTYQSFNRFFAVASAIAAALLISVSVVAQTTSWASGVGVYNQAQAVANDDFHYNRTFDAHVQAALLTVRTADPSTATVASNFYDAYSQATTEYHVALSSAVDSYRANQANDPSHSTELYVSDFDSANADYFKKIGDARNTFISELFGTGGTAKNDFITSLDAACASYQTNLANIHTQITAL